MITDVIVVYNDDEQIKKIGGTYTLKVSPFFTFIDERSRKNKKQAYSVKSHYAARLTPFAVCLNKETPIKAFYSETGNDIINELIQYLNEESISNSKLN
jgi:hypothetical protein